MAADTPTPQGTKPRLLLWLVLGFVVLSTMIVPLYLIAYASKRTADLPYHAIDATTRAAAEIMRTRINIQDITLTTIKDLQKKSKLVVHEATIDADIQKSEEYRSWGVYWGTNTARVVVKNAKVQFVIPLEQVGSANFTYDETAKKLTVKVPAPRVDEDMVAIDPAQISVVDARGGWARFDKQETVDRARQALKPKVIEQAKSPLFKRVAEDDGKTAMKNFLAPLIEQLGKEGVTVEIEYLK